MSETRQKKGVLNKVTAVLLSLWLLVLPMAVSADYANIENWGFFNASTQKPTQIKVGDIVSSSNNAYSARWIVQDISPDYTYDVFLDLVFDKEITDKTIFNVFQVYYLSADDNYNVYFYWNDGWKVINGLVSSFEFTSEKKLRIHVYYNTQISGLNYSRIALMQNFSSMGIAGAKVMGAGVGAYYDPGGSNYEEILQMINSNVENLPDRIKEVLDQHDHDVKTESSTEGNDKIDQAINALKNAIPVSSVKDAITPLMTACNYEGTNSVWTFPSITIPAIPGLFDEMKLSEEQSFDLSTYADDYIPETLLQLVRYLMTAGLILFAIKELMSIISQIFGGSGGGGDGG